MKLWKKNKNQPNVSFDNILNLSEIENINNKLFNHYVYGTQS